VEIKVYEEVFKAEDNYWWYVGLRNLVFLFIDRFSKKRNGIRILDAGCGTGKNLEICKRYNAFGLDISKEALKFCIIRKLNNLIRGSVCELPFKANSFDVVISLDVLYHMEVENDVKALKRCYQVLDKDGMLILDVPAYNFLRSRWDKNVHTIRRYTLRELKEKVEQAGFEVDRITYRITALFPVAAIKRIVDKIFYKKSENLSSDLKPLHNTINNFLLGILLFENKLIKLGLTLPFGLSVYCVARKKTGDMQ
jgi:SAM-dependent methyltransferase